VLFPQSVAGSRVDVVGMDNVATMFQVIDRLHTLGHQRIGFVGRCRAMAWASERFAGYVSALDRLGLAYQPEWVIDIDETPMLNEGHADYWRARLDRIEALRNNAGVQAWVCSSDWPAFQLYRGMMDRGYQVPKDLSITGFDDTEPVHLGCSPVTSVRVPREMIGEATLRRLLHLIDQPQSPPCQSNFPCELRLNGTIGSPSYAPGTSGLAGKAAAPHQ
jgi:DNA-binding LacI/PurR family transcriptional regulator